MLISTSLRQDARRRSRGGWTLVELLVAVTAGLIILAAFVAVTLSIRTTLVEVGNYSDLDKASRQTLDYLSRDIRNAQDVGTGSTATSLTITNTFSGTNLITYTWDGSNQLKRTVATLAGGPSIATTSRVMLTSCDLLNFCYFIRVPTNNLQFVSATNGVAGNPIKLVSVSWRCSRSVLGSKLNTESVQTANIAVRN